MMDAAAPKSRRVPQADATTWRSRSAAALRGLAGRSGQSPPPEPWLACAALVVAIVMVGLGLALLVVAVQVLSPGLLEARLGAVLGARTAPALASGTGAEPEVLRVLGVSALAAVTGGA